MIELREAKMHTVGPDDDSVCWGNVRLCSVSAGRDVMWDMVGKSYVGFEIDLRFVVGNGGCGGGGGSRRVSVK